MNGIPLIPAQLREKAKKIKLLTLDVDGIMTDGGLIQGDDGQEYKRFHARDGLGLRYLRESGVDLALITGRTSEVVKRRASELKAVRVYQGRHEKLPAFEMLCQELEVTPDQVAYMGDDIIDLPVLVRCGLALTVADAHAYVKPHAHWISTRNGGNGAVREACELILHSQGLLQPIYERATSLAPTDNP
ncbi:MAG: HAD hydrolase family protein [Gammaproteobacteria bacterium]|nr:HAD hydrolase family protein [Gammaproteobacteria bacterium]